MHHSPLIPLVAFAALTSACSYPRFQAKKAVEMTVPATSVTRLLCTSHNGNIVITGDPTATAVRVKAEVSVRGHTQDEANANLELLEVGQEQVGDQLELWGKYPTETLNNLSPGFAFTVTVPARMQLQLESHNGDLRATGTEGEVRLETHNGSIEASVTTAKLEVETHNGTVALDLLGSGPLDGVVSSHNGGIRLGVGGQRSATIEAETHNGSIEVGEGFAATSVTRNRLRAKIGDGSGKLTIKTHNGGVTLR